MADNINKELNQVEQNVNSTTNAINKETEAVNKENKALEERARLLEEGRKRAAENAAKDQSAGINPISRLNTMQINMEKIPIDIREQAGFKDSVAKTYENINEIRNRAEEAIKSGSEESLSKINNEIDLFEQDYNKLITLLADTVIADFRTKKDELNTLLKDIGTNKDEEGHYNSMIMDALRIHDTNLYNLISERIKLNDQIESEMGAHTQYGTNNFDLSGQPLNSSIQRAIGGKLKIDEDEILNSINQQIADIESEIELNKGFLSDSKFKEEAQRNIKELTAKLNNLREQLNEAVNREFMGYIEMYNSTVGSIERLNSKSISDELEYIRHEGIITDKGINEIKNKRDVVDVKQSNINNNDELNILKEIEEEKEKIIKDNSLINEQIIEGIYNEQNYNELLSKRQSNINGIKREIELINKYNSNPEEGAILDTSTKYGSKAMQAYNDQVSKGIENAEAFLNRINETQSSLNTEWLPFGNFDLNMFRELQGVLDSKYRVNLSGSDLEQYEKLSQLVEQIKTGINNIDYSGIKDSIAIANIQLNQLRNKDKQLRDFDATGGETAQYKRTYDELQQVIREIQLLENVKEQASENETTAKLFDVSKIIDYDNALKYLIDKRDQLGNSLDAQANKFRQANKEVPDLTNHIVELKNALVTLDSAIGRDSKGEAFKKYEQTVKSYDKMMKNVYQAQDKEYTNTNKGIEKAQLEAEKQAAKDAAEEAKRQAAAQKQAAKDAAEAAKEKARAEAEAQRAASEAQRQYEQNLNNVRNKVQEVTNYIKQALANTIKVVRAANNTVNKSIIVIIGVFEKLGSTVQRLIQLFGNFGNRVSGFNKQGNILKGTFTELKSKIDLLVGAFNKLYNNSFINEGKKLLSSVQTLNMLIGTELTTKTMEWATNLEHAFGLSAAGLIADLKELTAVMYGLGMSASDVQVAATNLEAVAMSLSATTGYDFSTVVNKIQSGMKGMTQSIDDLGLSVRESQMDAFLRKLKAQGGEYANIGTSFSQLTEQQRIYVRYAAIMDQFTSKEAYSAENYAKSLRTITGSLSILNSQIRGLKSDLGSLALQLFAKIIQPLIYIIYLVRQAVKWVANLLGIDITLNPKMNGSEDNVIQPIEDTTKALDEEAAAADKAKGSLDSLDHVSTMSESSSKNKGDDFDYSSLMNISDDYAKLLEDLGKMQDDFIEECKRKFWAMVNDIKDRFTKWIKDVTGRIIDWDFIKSNLYGALVNIKNTFKNIVDIARNTWKIIGGLIWSIGDDLDFSRLIFKFTKAFERLTKLVSTILDKIQKPIQDMYDKYLSPYVERLGDWIEDKLDELIAYFNNMIGWWEDPRNKKAIDDWFDNLGRHIKAIIMIIEALFQGGDRKMHLDEVGILDGEGMEGFKKAYEIAGNIHDVIGGLIVAFKELFGIDKDINDVERQNKTPDTVKSLIGLCTTLHIILRDVWDVIKGVLQNVLDFNKDGVLNWDDMKTALDFIKGKLDRVAEWLETNKEPIITLLSTAAETIGKIGEAKFDILMTVLEFITDNAETINNVLLTLQSVIDFVAKNPLLSTGIYIGVSIAGNVIKTAATAALWSSILGTSTLPEVFAGVAAAITGPIGIIIGILVAAVSWFTILWNKSEWFKTTITNGIEEIKQHWDESWAAISGDLYEITGGLDSVRETLSDLGIDLDNLFWNDLIQLLYKDTIRGQIELVKIAIDSLLWPLRNIISTLSGIAGLARNVKQLFTDISNIDLGNVVTNIAKVNGGVAGWIASKYEGKTSKLKGLGYANGGVPSSGSIFFANENGNTELVGNFGGYTGVANQSMIIEAMQNAMVQAIRSAGGMGNGGTTVNNFNIGNWLGDDASVRKLANRINTVNAKSNSNIANVGFVMS